MKDNKRIIRIFFALALLLAVFETFYFYSLMPSNIAIHFNAAGIADGWGPKQPFFDLIGIVFLAIAAVFGLTSLLIRLLPNARVNLPNKDYWMAPERRELTLRVIGNQMLFFGALTMLLLDGVLYLCCTANLLPVPAIPAEQLWGMLVLYAAVNIVFSVFMIRGYRRPAADQQQKL
jgi:uncharacterized membrane protein